ncbi:NAD-dependent DNA ligase LigA [Candidatus Mycoplasma mahonii]|uniref:NAD-dependent DNA ligase LigA n=1 Tax=Candidatus Mycoplasma mahonii TaxID=3004105 RepID=UPI0026EC7A83|nr:NAD-dependent DNA ligase LigA [Candidatus Mycoplasma mahonii]WKX02523.1 NAD-dependent DNA ligase LigA [Candidatus Mycoplasma mahonii]
MENLRDKIINLNKKLIAWSKTYYLNNNQMVSDEEYDGTYIIYSNLIRNNPKLEPTDSILKKVGAKVDNRFHKVTHKYKMFSLANAFSEDDLWKFDKHIKDLLHIDFDLEYILEYKIDGLSISLIYENGELIRAITRGDGLIGEDVTHNIKTLKSIPHKINYKKEVEFRGEVFMSNDAFDNLNKNGNNFANPRNAASGSLRQLNSSVAASRNLSAFIYEVPNKKIEVIKTHQGLLNFIKKNKLPINNEIIPVKGIQEVINTIKEMSEKRNDLGYVVDGIVIKVNDISLYEDIGYTVKFPKFMIAYKFPAEIAATTLEDIFPSIGRTGRVTYNAKLSPVRIYGSVISAATLHNADYIKKLGINFGDIVNVKKAGDIIPKVISIKTKNNDEIWIETNTCPSCGFLLKRFVGEVDQYCINEDCIGIKTASLEHFVSKKAMNIDGISTETIKILLDKKFITDAASIFTLASKKDNLLKLHGFKEKSVDKMISSIENSKNTDLGNFLFGLGIRHLGEKGSRILAKRFRSIENIINSSQKDFMLIRDLGKKVSDSVVEYFYLEKNINQIKKMFSYGLNLTEVSVTSSKLFENKTFVITGTLSKPRKVFQDIIENNSGNVSSAISKNIDYLLMGENPGNKSLKAKELNVKMINENEFKSILEVESWKE